MQTFSQSKNKKKENKNRVKIRKKKKCYIKIGSKHDSLKSLHKKIRDTR